MNAFEIKILDAIQQTFGCKFMDFIMPKISYLGDYGIVCIALSLLFIMIPKTRKMGISSGLALFIGLIVCNLLLKPLVFRVRPYFINTDAVLLVKRLEDGSFPSGHALAVFETATAFMKHDKRFGIPALVLAFLVAFSRLYLYVHYPSDVIAGILLGVIIGLTSCFIIKKLYIKYDLQNKI